MATARAWTGTEWVDVSFGTGQNDARVYVDGAWVSPCADGRDFRFWNGTEWESLCSSCLAMLDPEDWEWELLADTTNRLLSSAAVSGGDLWYVDRALNNTDRRVVRADLETGAFVETVDFGTNPAFLGTVAGAWFVLSTGTGSQVREVDLSEQAVVESYNAPVNSANPVFCELTGTIYSAYFASATGTKWVFDVAERTFTTYAHPTSPANMSYPLFALDADGNPWVTGRRITSIISGLPAYEYFYGPHDGDRYVLDFPGSQTSTAVYDARGLWVDGEAGTSIGAWWRLTGNYGTDNVPYSWHPTSDPGTTYTDIIDTVGASSAISLQLPVRGNDCARWVGGVGASMARFDRLGGVAVGAPDEDGGTVVPIGADGSYLYVFRQGPTFGQNKLYRVKVS